MRLVVAIPTLGRRAHVEQLVSALESQTRPPDAVIVSAPDESHFSTTRRTLFPVHVVFGKPGLCRQRNAVLARAAEQFDIITFLDDDFVPAEDYLARVVTAFETEPRFSVVMGRVILDGVNKEGLDWEEAKAALCERDTWSGPDVIDHVGAYGCNMSIRVNMIGDLRFDERLVLYGWQEDIDFSSRLRKHGRVVCVTAIRGVHLGIKSGRVSGLRFGYSQVVNPLYLIRKGSVPASFALPLMIRNLAANVVKSLRPEPYVDRRGRLRGNLIAISHVLRGRIEPEFVLDL